jgi:redox-sensitive bicupin YhaK (pirin superfamily)
MVVFGDGDQVRIRASENSEARFVLIAGGPFREPIVPYGPFVMNTREEILQALDELKFGTFVKDQG